MCCGVKRTAAAARNYDSRELYRKEMDSCGRGACDEKRENISYQLLILPRLHRPELAKFFASLGGCGRAWGLYAIFIADFVVVYSCREAGFFFLTRGGNYGCYEAFVYIMNTWHRIAIAILVRYMKM